MYVCIGLSVFTDITGFMFTGSDTRARLWGGGSWAWLLRRYFILILYFAATQLALRNAHMVEQLWYSWRNNFVEGKIWDHPWKMTQKWSKFGSGVNLMIQIKPPANSPFPSRWAHHAKNSSWHILLKYSSPSIVHQFLVNFDSRMVVIPSRLWLLLFHPRLSGTAGWGARTLCSRSLRKYSSRKSRMEEQ